MSESLYHKVSGVRTTAVRFQMNASANEVVARLLEAVRQTGLQLLKVFGDGNRVYPFDGQSPGQSASSWRAEFFWHSPTLMSAWRLAAFLKRAENFLELPGRVRLEVAGGQRDPREDIREVRPSRLWRPGADAQTPHDKKP